MSDVAVRVEGLAKEYILGDTAHYQTLKESLARWLGSPWRDRGGEGPGRGERLDAVRDVSFDIAHGEVLGVIGSNGAGKSTVLKILSRIVAPTAGRVEIFGRVGSLLEVGIGFHPELTGRENVYLNGAILGMRRAEIRAKFEEIVEFAEMARFIDTPVKRYSSGMYTRLAFAVAAHLDSEILIVDEVLSVGDASFQRKSLRKIRDAAGEGRTVLFVSHNMGSVRDLTDRCLLLEGGRLAAEGAPSVVIARYLEGTSGPARERELVEVARPPWIDDARAIELTKVSIAVPTSGQTPDAPLEVELGFQSRAALEGVTFSVAVCHPNGTYLVSSDSEEAEARFAVAAGAEGVVRLRLPAPRLGAGLYQLNVAATRADGIPLDIVHEALAFEVIPDAAELAAPARARSRSVGVRIVGEWSLEEA